MKIDTNTRYLAMVDPILAEEWHPTKNGELTAEHVATGSKKKVWWLGKCHHEWEAAVGNRWRGRTGCPYCSGAKVLQGFNDLASVNPSLILEWHPAKNPFSPNTVTFKSGRKVWWIGKCGHEWEANISSRSNGQGCSVCVGKTIMVGVNDLASIKPALVTEWHPTKNGNLTPTQVTAASRRKIWWMCSKGHEWNVAPHSRKRGSGCPFCANQRVLVGYNDLGTTNPALAAEWHPTKNGQLTVKQITAGVSKKVWWLGECNHEWNSSVGDRNRGVGCPLCPKISAIKGSTDLATVMPHLAAEWHPTKNGNLTPEQFTAGSSKRIWWLAACQHEWDGSIKNRVKLDSCPICSGRRALAGYNDLTITNPVLAAEWHPTKNGNLTPEQFTAGSSKEVWWQCSQEHEWSGQIRIRNRGVGCPFCPKIRAVKGVNDLVTVNPILAAEWHPRRNEDLTAEQVTAGVNKKVWWQCKEKHEWEATVSNRRSWGCPVCSGSKVLTGYNDLKTKNPAVAARWHPTKNGSLTPEKISAGTNRKVWWQCEKNHEWSAIVSDANKRKGRCPICSGRKVLAGYNDLATKNPNLAAEWHPDRNGTLTATKVSTGSERKVWWLGGCGHEWEAIIYSRVKGAGCPNCGNHVSMPEVEIKAFLENLGISVESSNRTVLDGKEIDLWIPTKRLGIEYNGLYWHSEKYRNKVSHYEKWATCKNQDIQLIQIWEDDWKLRPEIVMQTLAQKLGVSKPNSTIQSMEIIHITEHRAAEFLNENYLKGFATGQYYLGLVDGGDKKTLQAVMVLDGEPNSNNKSIEITRYASISSVADDFSKLLSGAIKVTTPESIIINADHCEGYEGFYTDRGFIAEKELPPDYMYVVRVERMHRSEYSMERFRDDPGLLWEEGLTEMELADLNGLNRIWDAGKTLYRLYL